MTQNTEDDLSTFLLSIIKAELNKSDIKINIIKPLLIYLLYYIIPFVIIFVLLNFFATIIAVYLVFHFKTK